MGKLYLFYTLNLGVMFAVGQPDVMEKAIKHEMRIADQTLMRFDASATASPRVGILCLPGYRIYQRVCSQSPPSCVINVNICQYYYATRVSRYQKGKTGLDFNEARDDGVLG